jgi:RNA polymerase sigma-70 factor (ECF subfamily)
MDFGRQVTVELVIASSTGPKSAADLDLAQRCAAGDRAAHRLLFDTQRERVHIVLFRILGSNQDIDDLVQEAFVQIFRSLPRYRGEASLATWVDRITARTAFRYLSSRPVRTVRLELVSQHLETSDPNLEEHAHLREVARRLYAILDRLAPKYRVAYALHVVDERPLAEVATIVDISLVAARTRVWRAQRMVEKRAKSDPVLRDFLSQQKRDLP